MGISRKISLMFGMSDSRDNLRMSASRIGSDDSVMPLSYHVMRRASR